MVLRYCKITVVSCVAVLLGAIALNNIFNYDINFSYVEHVLNMKALPTLAPHWRAFHSPLAHHAVYLLIIVAEMVAAILCLGGATDLYKIRHGSNEQFANAKSWALIGLTIGFVLFTTGFITIGGEWFYLWLAPAPWSGALNAATRLLVIDSAALVFLTLPD